MANLLALPIDDFLAEALKHLQTHSNLVVTAAPGAGKTTRLPAYLAKHAQGKVLVLEPRRMAAMAAAMRVSEEQNWQLGQEVGYQVRFANQSTEKTKLIFLTEALLSRKLAHDPELVGVEYVVLDEFHERSVHVDLALGLLREMQELGGTIKLIVMSATLEAQKISAYLGNAPVLDVPGKLFPLEVKYQKNSQTLQMAPAFFENLTAHIREAAKSTNKDILVFLPGTGEIERTSQQLETWARENNLDIVPLHGSLPLEAQRKALQAGSRRRVILSTNIAESSVTVDGVACVIDTGLAKNMKFDLRTGFSRLELGRISRASAQQRAGRSARQYPGVCYRLWNKLDENSMPAHEVAEIQRTELSDSLLFLAAQGVRDFESFSWFEKPNSLYLKKAVDNLLSLEALDGQNKITAIGKKLLLWPLPPRLAKLMLVAIEMKMPQLGADIAAILQERDFMLKQSSEAYIADKLESDVLLRLDVLNQFRDDKAPRNTHRAGLQMVEKSAQQIYTTVKDKTTLKVSNLSQAVQKLLLTSFADRLCRRRQAGQDRALMVAGRGVKLSNDSLVRESEFFLALDGVENSKNSETQVSMAAGIDKALLFAELGSHIRKKKDLQFDREKGQFYVREGKYFMDLALEEGSISIATAKDVSEHLPEVLTQEWSWVLKENEALCHWLERISYLLRSKKVLSEKIQAELADLDEATVFSREQRQQAFAMAASGEKDFHTVVKKDLIYFFESLLSADILDLLQKQVPGKVQVPSGNFLKVHYPPDREPYLEVRIQEVFGWNETPKLLNGLKALTLHLLGPNYRPMQVTSDLNSFWQNGYPEVRKELRTRYPKHSWPDDPLSAKAVAKGRPVKN